MERGEGAGEVERVQRLDRADAHAADDRAGQAAEVGARRVQLGERAPGAGQEQLARVGQLHASGGAREQRDAQLRLQLADLHRHRGLRDVQERGGAAETALPHDRVEVDELPQFHAEML